MIDIDDAPQVLTHLAVNLTPKELEDKILAGQKKQQFVAAATDLLEKLDNSWNPAIAYRWLSASMSKSNPNCCNLQQNGNCTSLALGHSSSFMKEAQCALIACYTAGDAIENESSIASKEKRFLDSYILDIINLLVLEKTGNIINQMAEDMAKERNWGVSPFLSPGSVHGWELEEQHKLAALLPLSEIGVSIRTDGVLHPFKSLSCMIGIGGGYSSTSVGTTCQVCSKKDTCQMRKD